MTRFPCPYLKGEVELTEERERHIGGRHPDLLPEHRERIAETLADPDQVRRSIRFGSAMSFSRWYTDLRRGKHVVVVVVSGLDLSERHWIITAYIARKLAEGEVEWRRS
ncbi:hypothetical protein MYX65_08530 [Acidobacteria bacterium AH-259-L09]|nr:hypothetical protein [Acidobacteria bacterium AH-259-L09]